jgi:hypothetical protein
VRDRQSGGRELRPPGAHRPPRLSRCERSDAEARGLTRAETPSYQATNRSTKPVLNNKLRAAITLTRKRVVTWPAMHAYICVSLSLHAARVRSAARPPLLRATNGSTAWRGEDGGGW